MPEGDTIRRLAERINRRFAGQRCGRCVTRDPRLVGVDFAGAVLLGADAHGKHLLTRFDDGRTLFAHLRMDGSFVVGPAADAPTWKRRIELWMEDGRLTAVDVPILGVVATDKEATIVGHLGPDLCGPELPDLDLVARPDVGRARSAARRRPARPAPRRWIRQRLRRGIAVHRRRVAAPARSGRSTDCSGSSPSAPPSSARTPNAGRRTRLVAASTLPTTGSTPAVAGRARCAAPRSTDWTTATVPGAGSRCGARGASSSSRDAPSTSTEPAASSPCTPPAASRMYPGA